MPEQLENENEYGRIKTNFMDKQAELNSTSIFKSLPVQILLGIVAIGLIFVVWKGAEFFMNLEKNTAMKNVLVSLQHPTMRDGIAIVDVTLNNLNARSVSKIDFRYNILGPSGSTVDTGVVTIPNSVPAGDARMFTNVKLGPLTDNAARMHAELVNVELGPKSNLSAGQESRFAELCGLKDEEKADQFKQFIDEAPNFVPGYIELGTACVATNELDKAIEALKKAVQLEPDNGNAHYHLGIAYERQGQKKEAQAELQKAYDLAPHDPDVQRDIQYFGVPTADQ